MQITETKAEGLKREFKVVLPADQIEEQVNTKIAELTRTVRIPGFRPGKVPASLLKKKYGPSVLGEVIEQMVGDSSNRTVTDRGLRPATQPKIEITSFDEGTDLEYTMAFELMPEIGPVDFSTVALEQLVTEPSDEDIGKSLQRIADSQRTSKAIASKRKSKKGDILVIDFVGRVDGEEFDGGKAEAYELELGSNSFIPGFEDQLVGAKAGEKVMVNVSFPEEYGAENLAGKAAEFEVDVQAIHQPVPAEVDDELAKKVGLDDLEALKKTLREDHEREFKQISRMRLKRTLLDALAEEHTFEVPEGMVESEFEAIWNQFEEQRKSGKAPDDEADAGKSDDEMKAEFRPIAERRVRLGLLLVEVGRLNNLEVGQDEVNRAISAEARRYPGQEKAVFDYYRDTPEAMQAIRAPLMEDKVVDFILEMANITEKKVSIEELLKDPDEAEEAVAEAKPKPKKKAAPRKKAKKEEDEAGKEE
jgi:trigger factor